MTKMYVVFIFQFHKGTIKTCLDDKDVCRIHISIP